ncbi:hypothetical protein [Paenarthrobacter sp. TA1.8]|uniref:hypothetical protein n=1 Tax=Paenarthrobacter sp. TA1.8 TaxID=3400219 RepID=UPI003B433554
MTAASHANDTSDCTDLAREQIQMLTNRNTRSPAYLNEKGNIKTNFERALGTGLPKDLPLLLFVVAENKQTPEWLELHHRQAASVTNGTVVPCPASTTSTTRTRGRSLTGSGTGGGTADASLEHARD